MNYEALIYDAERRIGSYIAGGGSSEDKYVKDRVAKIKSWIEQLADIERRMIMDIHTEKHLATEALAALTRLRQGCNPLNAKKLDQFLKDEATFKKNCVLLSIPESYDAAMLTFLRKLARQREEVN